jgi:hypothetical protein
LVGTGARLACLAIGLVVASGSSLSTGCTTRQCVNGHGCVYSHLGHGDISCPFSDVAPATLTEDFIVHSGQEVIWYSAPFTSAWLPYNGEESVQFFYPDELLNLLTPAVGPSTVPTSVFTYISSAAPTDVGGFKNIVNAAGQLDEYTYIDNHVVEVTNASCADYSIRIEVHVAIPDAGDPGSTMPDAGLPEASAEDGGADGAPADGAPADASTAPDAGPPDAATD